MTECGCISCGVEDPIEEISEEIVICTREDIVCKECGCKIKPGEKYESFVGNNYGEMYKAQTCMDCLSIRNEFFCEGWDYGQVLEDVQYHVEEMNGEISSECLARLTPGGRATVLEFIDDVFDDINEDEGNENE